MALHVYHVGYVFMVKRMLDSLRVRNEDDVLDFISGVLGIGFILFFLFPVFIFAYVLFYFKVDLDHDGKEDNKWIWQK
jgi:hypothetical protein